MLKKLFFCALFQVMGASLFSQTGIQGDLNRLKSSLKDAGDHGAACSQAQLLKAVTTTQKQAFVAPPCNKYVIPIVFHVVDQNPDKVTDAQIQSAIDILNEDFTATNSELPNSVSNYYQPLIGSLDIEFRLAKLDPQGNPTTGIDRVVADGICNNTSSGDRASNCPVKVTAPAWNTDNYLNVWIINDVYGGTTNYSTSSGWAFLSSSVPFIEKEEDGIVYNHIFLGREGTSEVDSYLGDMARVFTHEVGHYLNLKHTHTGWCGGGADDEVLDTPPVKYNNCGSCCPSDVNNPEAYYLSCDEVTPIAVQSFMAYSGCTVMYTTGQATRMDESLQSQYRNNLWSESNQKATGVWNCISVGSEDLKLKNNSIHLSPNPASTMISIDIQAENAKEIQIFDLTGKLVYSNIISAYTNASKTLKVDISKQHSGIYFVQVVLDNGAVLQNHFSKN